MHRPDGMTLRIEALRDGLHPDMPVASVLTADGETVEVEVSRRSLVDGRLPIGWPVGRWEDGALLVEFGTQYGVLTFGPHFGSQRVWVPEGSLERAEGRGEGGRECKA